MAQQATLEREALLGGRELDLRDRFTVVVIAVREAPDLQHLRHLLAHLPF